MSKSTLMKLDRTMLRLDLLCGSVPTMNGALSCMTVNGLLEDIVAGILLVLESSSTGEAVRVHTGMPEGVHRNVEVFTLQP